MHCRFFYVVILVFGVVSTLVSTSAHSDIGLPEGKFYEVNQHRMHIYCAGKGDITVVAESGIGGSSLEWSLVRDLLGETIRFCSYDRAGYGWSDPGTSTRTTKNIVTELYKLLEISGEKAPYILLGHSFGGFIVRYFASQYPSEVSGIVLLDSSHPDQIGEMQTLVTGTNKRTNGINPVKMTEDDSLSKLPEEKRLQAVFLNSRRKAIFAQMDEIKHFQISADQVLKAKLTWSSFCVHLC